MMRMMQGIFSLFFRQDKFSRDEMHDDVCCQFLQFFLFLLKLVLCQFAAGGMHFEGYKLCTPLRVGAGGHYIGWVLVSDKFFHPLCPSQREAIMSVPAAHLLSSVMDIALRKLLAYTFSQNDSLEI